MPRSLALLALVASLFLTPSSTLAQCQSFPALPYGSYVDGDGIQRDLLLDLAIPTNATGPTPLVVWVHGGGWSGGSRVPIPSRVTALCARGYAIASIDYRLTGVAIWPAQIQDCKGAIRWLRANAATYNLDPNRFGVWGSSAGGHLVAFLGASGGVGPVTIGNVSLDLEGTTGGNLEHSSRVQAVADWYGPVDLLQKRFYPSGIEHESADSPEGRLIGGAVSDNPERAATANPVTFLSPDDPPFQIMHGTIDNTVPFHQSELLHGALLGRGLRSTFFPILGAGHGGAQFETAANLQTVYAFFDANLLNLGSPVVSLTALDASLFEGGGQPARFRLDRTGSTAGALTVRWSSAGTATLTQDFTAPSNQVTFPAGAASVTVNLTPLDDTLVEGTETIRAVLSQATTYRLAASATSATTSLIDNESASGLPVVTITALDATAQEAGPTTGTFRLSRSGSTTLALTVSLRTSGTATSGQDYTAAPTSATFPAGQASLDLVVTPVLDARLEPTETVILSLNPGAAYALGTPSTASVRIDDRDRTSTLPIVSAVAIDFAAGEAGANPGAFLVSRTGPTTSALTAAISPGGTATEGSDYAALPLTVTFGIGVNRVTVPLTPLDDALTEGVETVTVVADPAAGLLVGPASAAVSITDND